MTVVRRKKSIEAIMIDASLGLLLAIWLKERTNLHMQKLTLPYDTAKPISVK